MPTSASKTAETMLRVVSWLYKTTPDPDDAALSAIAHQVPDITITPPTPPQASRSNTYLLVPAPVFADLNPRVIPDPPPTTGPMGEISTPPPPTPSMMASFYKHDSTSSTWVRPVEGQDSGSTQPAGHLQKQHEEVLEEEQEPLEPGCCSVTILNAIALLFVGSNAVRPPNRQGR